MASPIRVPVAPSTASDIAIGVEQGAIYELIGEDGYRAVINDSTDRDFAGFLTEPPSGLDSAGVRESAETKVEGDGGIHGSFWADRRPVTLTGIIDPSPRSHDILTGIPTASVAAFIADKRINRLQRATRAKRGNALIRWTPVAAPPVQLVVKRQQPLRVGQRRPKTFLVAMVAADHRIQAQAQTTAAGTGAAGTVATSSGNTDSPPVITLRGAWNSPAIINAQVGAAIVLSGNGGLIMGATDVLVIDVAAGTAFVNDTVNVYDRVDFLSSNWWTVQGGVANPILVTGGTAAQTFDVVWRDMWE